MQSRAKRHKKIPNLSAGENERGKINGLLGNKKDRDAAAAGSLCGCGCLLLQER